MAKILIAEDDRILSAMIAKSLAKHTDKFEIVQVRDGKAAIAILKQEPVSLVITDIQMPHVNGIILLAYVHTYHPRTPCVVMTSYGTSRLKAKLPRDLVRFFQKPFDVDDFVKAVIAILDRSEPYETEQGISVVNFLNMIEMEKISCLFRVLSADEPEGEMYFKDGVLYDAGCGDLQGEAAVLELIARKMSTYRFKDFPEKEITRRIKTDLQELIRNAVLVDSEDEISII